MSIHSEHPFLPPESERNPTRRFRGRMPQPVTVWCAEQGGVRAGWTVSSIVVADGDPPEVLGLVDEDSDLAELATLSRRVAVNLLGWQHRSLADAFAGLAPAPGGPFRQASWTATAWGPVLADAVGWLGVELTDTTGRLGWTQLLRGTCARIEIGGGDTALSYVRGRYRPVPLQ